jgi:hypothetical protein
MTRDIAQDTRVLGWLLWRLALEERKTIAGEEDTKTKQATMVAAKILQAHHAQTAQADKEHAIELFS